jgi:hypothetical protein
VAPELHHLHKVNDLTCSRRLVVSITLVLQPFVQVLLVPRAMRKRRGGVDLVERRRPAEALAAGPWEQSLLLLQTTVLTREECVLLLQSAVQTLE